MPMQQQPMQQVQQAPPPGWGDNQAQQGAMPLVQSMPMPMQQQPMQQAMAPAGGGGGIGQQYAPPQGNFTIQGNESQILHYRLNQGQAILCESGAMRYQSPGITPEARMGQLCAACVGGESLFRGAYTNDSGPPGNLVGVAPPFNANIVPVNLNQYPGLVIKDRAFLAAEDVDIQILTERVKSVGACVGGMGLLIHPLQGQGTVFLNAGGTIMFRHLAPQEVLYTSTGAVVAFQNSCEFTVEMVGGGLKNICCGGQGLFNTKLVGPGLVILQSLSLQELRTAIMPAGGKGGGGGALADLLSA